MNKSSLIEKYHKLKANEKEKELIKEKKAEKLVALPPFAKYNIDVIVDIQWIN